MSRVYRPGFVEPVSDAQTCFRAVLDATARPGSVRPAGGGLSPPPPLDPATGAVLLTLVDADTPLWLDPAAEAAADWIAFHCGAPFVREREAASFAVCLSLPDLGAFAHGTHEAPEAGATVLLQVPTLRTGCRFRLTGPGLSGPASLAVDGLPAGFARDWAAARARFPLGVDLILCAGASLCALPRSVAVEDA